METLELLLDRQIRTEKTTIGTLTIAKNPFKCFVLEDKDRGLDQNMPLSQIEKLKQYGVTAIPTGRYKVTLTYSNRFKKILPLLEPVKGYVGIRIHPGNKDVDTLGCLLTGYKHAQDCIVAGTSTPAFNDLMKILQAHKGDIYITIR